MDDACKEAGIIEHCELRIAQMTHVRRAAASQAASLAACCLGGLGFVSLCCFARAYLQVTMWQDVPLNLDDKLWLASRELVRERPEGVRGCCHLGRTGALAHVAELFKS